jgi:hypothetical protein
MEAVECGTTRPARACVRASMRVCAHACVRASVCDGARVVPGGAHVPVTRGGTNADGAQAKPQTLNPKLPCRRGAQQVAGKGG